MANNSSTSDPSEGTEATRSQSISSCPSDSTGSTHNIDSAQQITLIETIIEQDTWGADIEIELLNIDEFKQKSARAKHWKEVKQGLKKYVAKKKSDAISKKFEMEIKVIGR